MPKATMYQGDFLSQEKSWLPAFFPVIADITRRAEICRNNTASWMGDIYIKYFKVFFDIKIN